MPNGLKVIENPVLPPRTMRVLSPTFHVERDDAYMERLLDEWRPRALKAMVGTACSPAWLMRQVPRMQPGSYLHMRVYLDRSQGAEFNSDHFPRGQTPAYIADNFVKALRSQLTMLQTQHGHCIPVLETWCEQGGERDELDAIVAIAQRIKAEFPDVLIAGPNQSIGTYNEEWYWERVYQSGLLEQDNVLIAVHGYATALPWTALLPGWQANEVAARWPNFSYDTLPWSTYAVWDGSETVPPTWTMMGIFRSFPMLQRRGVDLSRLKFCLTEIFLDDANRSGIRDRSGKETGERGWRAYARAGAWELFKKAGQSDEDFCGELLHWTSIECELATQHHPWLKYYTIFVESDLPYPLGWWDFVTEGKPREVWLQKEGRLTGGAKCAATPAGSGTNIRKLPYYPEGELLTTLRSGERVPALGVATVTQTDGTVNQWVKVDYQGGTGWMNRGYVTLSCASLPAIPAPPLNEDPPPDEPTVEELLAEIAALKAERDAVLDAIETIIDEVR
ncbi:MAG: hypothetical protein AMXMBFR13_48780 [Phycisphaerae bacterium]